jgi:hypothetical protein
LLRASPFAGIVDLLMDVWLFRGALVYNDRGEKLH